jgi:hypothetical protein
VALSFQILDETKERRNQKFEKSNTRPNRLILYSRMKLVLDDEMGEILPPVQLSPHLEMLALAFVPADHDPAGNS